nr:hypothetical protein Q903MT_gene1774 [Picea sitchensis]
MDERFHSFIPWENSIIQRWKAIAQAVPANGAGLGGEKSTLVKWHPPEEVLPIPPAGEHLHFLGGFGARGVFHGRSILFASHARYMDQEGTAME